MKQKWISLGAMGVSLLTHAWIIAAAPSPRVSHDEKAAPTIVEFSALVPEPVVIPQPEVEKAPEVEPDPVVEPVVAREAPASAEPAEAAPEDAAEPPPELTGTTLLAEGEGGFEAELGSGRARNGAIRAGVSRPLVAPAAPKKTVARPSTLPPAVVALGELSKRPVPPDLGGALIRNYPPEARRQGKSGEAKVRARIEATGSIVQAKVSFESEAGFGTACRKTLLTSRWSAPLDAQGKAVATWVSYSCKFRID